VAKDRREILQQRRKETTMTKFMRTPRPNELFSLLTFFLAGLSLSDFLTNSLGGDLEILDLDLDLDRDLAKGFLLSSNTVSRSRCLCLILFSASSKSLRVSRLRSLSSNLLFLVQGSLLNGDLDLDRLKAFLTLFSLNGDTDTLDLGICGPIGDLSLAAGLSLLSLLSRSNLSLFKAPLPGDLKVDLSFLLKGENLPGLLALIGDLENDFLLNGDLLKGDLLSGDLLGDLPFLIGDLPGLSRKESIPLVPPFLKLSTLPRLFLDSFLIGDRPYLIEESFNLPLLAIGDRSLL